MLTTKQISEIMNCCVMSAKRRIKNAGIKSEMQSFAHGKREIWDVTEEQLREIMAEEEKDAKKIAMQQAAGLNALEAAMTWKNKTPGKANQSLTGREHYAEC